MMTEIKVVLCVVEMEHAVRYHGQIKIGKTTFSYKLGFSSSVPGHYDQGAVGSETELRAMFPLQLMRRKWEIELDTFELGFFFGVITPTVITFYELRNRHLVLENDWISSFRIILRPEHLAMLASPKFECF